jgi:Pseudouridylate synthases, 23S RNA-specific
MERKNKSRQKDTQSSTNISREKIKFTVYAVKEAGELLDFLIKAKDGISRNSAKSLLAHRQVYVDNVITSQYNFALKPGMKVQISKEKGRKEFQSNFLKILYEDAYLIIIDKKEGLPTASSKPKERSALTLLNEYVTRTGKQHRTYTVNRLDRDTSGLMIFAKNEKIRDTFNEFRDKLLKTVKFVGIVCGELEKDSGTSASWLDDNKLYVTHSNVIKNNGEKAITHYKVIKRANGYSLVELELGMGKKNQIRVHMDDLKHPILGDNKFDETNPLKRLGLHAFKLEFYHPVTERLMEFETVYPSDFKKVMLKKANHID